MSLLLARARRIVAASSSLAAAAPTQRVGARAFATLFAEEDKAFHVWNLLEAKRKSKLTFTEIAERTGLTNAYVAQLFYRQAQLKKDTVAKLKAAVPALSKDDLEVMQEIPFRSYHRDIIRTEPLIYRLEEAVLHYGSAIKAIINENFGDGIMSAIDVQVSIDKTKGVHGEDRVLITMNGKFLPHVEQTVGLGPSGTATGGSKSTKSTTSSSSGGGLVKRSRGRPAKKNNTVGLMSSLSTLSTPPPSPTDTAEQQQKRGRGRPRKQPALPSLAVQLSTAAGAGAGKRRAGRPRKQQEGEEELMLQAAPTKIVVTGEEEEKEKRGRGRPKGSKSSKPAAAQIWV